MLNKKSFYKNIVLVVFKIWRKFCYRVHARLVLNMVSGFQATIIYSYTACMLHETSAAGNKNNIYLSNSLQTTLLFQ